MLSYALRELVRYNVHIGHYYWECDFRLDYFLIGYRNLIHIINLFNTIYNLKKILFIIYNLGLTKQRILLVNNINYELKSNLHKLNKNKLWYINNKWIGGLLTNQKHIYIYNEKLFKKYYEVGYKSILPSFVFSSNIENNGSSVFEASILNIVNSSLFDSNLGFYGILYKIPSNDDNFAIMFFFIKILAKIYIKSIYWNIKKLIATKDFIKAKKKKKAITN